jgi:hypothetical protein
MRRSSSGGGLPSSATTRVQGLLRPTYTGSAAIQPPKGVGFPDPLRSARTACGLDPHGPRPRAIGGQRNCRHGRRDAFHVLGVAIRLGRRFFRRMLGSENPTYAGAKCHWPYRRSGLNRFRRSSTPARSFTQLSKTDRFGQCRPRRSVIGCDHRIVGGKIPFHAILIRRQAVRP